MKKILFLIVIGVAVGGFFLFRGNFIKSEAEFVEPEPQEPEIVVTYESYTIEDGDTFTTAAEALGIGYEEALAIVDAAAEVFDFTSIKLGKEIKIVSEDGEVKRLEYEPGTEYVITVDLTTGNYETQKSDIAYDIEIASADVTIDSSLFVSGLEAGLTDVLILQFAEVFAWEVDFATQIQKGDSMQVVYEKRFRNGEEVGVGDVLAGTFTNVGETSSAYRFVGDDGEAGYYDAGGSSLVRPFLKAPLAYNRISSGYTNARFHPITGRTTPHLAIDYAAPTGTPIRAVGDGSVIHAQYSGGYGHFVKIRHNGTYQTNYAHLSRYAVSAGDQVKQGDVIGYVGSTGFSTGPHLHYEVVVNGDLVNPLEVEFPKGDAIEEGQIDAFFAERDRLNELF